MKLDVKNTARLAVVAGLCASLTLGGAPMMALAVELGTGDAEEPQRTEVSAAPENEGDKAAPAGDGEEGVRAGATEDADDAGGPEGAAASNGGADEEPAATPQTMTALSVAGDAGETSTEGWVEDAEKKTVAISSAAALEKFADNVNGGNTYKGWTISLVGDINLADSKWIPIGSDKDHSFMGTFVGTGYTISNLTVNRPEESNIGLFGYVANPAKLVDITVENAVVTGKSDVGVIVGAAFTGSASGCTVKGAIDVTGNYKVGGMFGGGYASIDNCHVNATGSVTGIYAAPDFEGDNVGGLIGFRGEGNGIVSKGCSVSGISVAGTRKVGGLIGSAFTDNRVEECSVSGVSVTCNAAYEYGTDLGNSTAMGFGGIIGLYTSQKGKGTLKDCSVSDISLSVENEQLAATGKVTLGYVSGGQRCGKAPDAAVEVSGINVSGNNTGSNAEQKFPGSAAMNGTSNVFAQGSGTAEDPYIISSVDDLKLFRETVNSTGLTYEGRHLKLADGAEFDLSGEQWASIGTSSHKFMGTFDGNGATIKGLTDGGKFGTYGLFGYISSATIKNMKFVDVKFEYSGSNRGAVAGYLYGTNTIENIEVSGSIAGNDYVGGIAGRPYLNANNPGTLTIKNCVNNATISGKAKIGGIVGYARADVAGSTLCVVEGCVNNGAVSDAQYAGGIAGWAYNAELKGCTNTVRVSGSTSAGGIVGNTNQNVKIDSCKNSGEIVMNGAADSGEGRNGAGGIIGVSNSGNAVVTKCANTGSVAGVKSAGGIIGGTAAAGDTIENCYNGGAIAATGDGAVAAGIYAYNNSTSPVKACFNDGDVRAEKGTVYQIGLSNFWYEPAPGSKIASCYFTAEDGKIYAAAEDGKGESIEQKDMTRGELAETLNNAGGVKGFWQAQNGSVQPDSLIPGAWDDEGKAVVEVCDARGTVVERYESVAAAFTAARDGQTIKLLAAAEIDASIEINGNKNVTFDLNGKVLEAKGPSGGAVHAFKVKSAGLTIKDSSEGKMGKISAMGAGSRGVILLGNAAVMLESGTIEAAEVGIAVNSGLPNQRVEVKGGTITSGNGILAQGNGIAGNTVVKMSGGEINGKNAGIISNGTVEKGGVNISITGGVITATNESSDALYLPAANSVTTITGGKIIGASGIEIRAGELHIGGDATITATGKAASTPNPSGGTMLGAALSVVQHTTKQDIKVTIEGNPKFTGDYALWENNTQDPSAVIEGIVLDVKGGSFDGKVYSADCDQFISGGSFDGVSSDDLAQYLAEGFGLNELQDGGYGVHKHVWADELGSNEDGHWSVCTKCDEKTEVIPHIEKTVGAKDATCGEGGYTGDIVCADCGYVIEKGSAIPATGKHAAGDTWKTDGTSHWHECTDCGARLDEAEHTSSEWTVNSTDHWHVCDVCGAAYDVAAHDFGDWKVTREATATKAGVREHTCKTCGKVVSEEIPALGSKPAGKPGKGDKLAQTGDAALFGAAAAGIAGVSTAIAGVFTRRRRK